MQHWSLNKFVRLNALNVVPFSFCFLAVLLSTGCASLATEKGAAKSAKDSTKVIIPPKNLLSETKFISILADFHIAEAVVSQIGVRDSISKINRFERYEYNIFKRQGVDSAAYHSTYRYYMAQNEKAKVLMVVLLDTLKKREKKGMLE